MFIPIWVSLTHFSRSHSQERQNHASYTYYFPGLIVISMSITCSSFLTFVALASVLYLFVSWVLCDSCEEDREAALKVINGHVWKGRELGAKVSCIPFVLPLPV